MEIGVESPETKDSPVAFAAELLLGWLHKLVLLPHAETHHQEQKGHEGDDEDQGAHGSISSNTTSFSSSQNFVSASML